MKRIAVSKRLRPLWIPMLVLGGIPSCGVEVVPPPETVTLEIACPDCRGLGIDTVYLHEGETVRKVAIINGRADANVSGISVVEHKVWFGTSSGPMEVDVTSREPGDRVEERESLEIVPLEWSDSVFADTSVGIPLRDSTPKRLAWKVDACVGRLTEWLVCDDYAYEWSAKDTIDPVPGEKTALLHMPRLVAREGASVSVRHRFGYRGYVRKATSLRPPPDIAWPPTVDWSASRLGPDYSWKASIGGGRRESIQLMPRAGVWRFHRVVFDDKKRLWEDSGSWDSTAGMARFARRGPGIPASTDSTKFRPLVVSQEEFESWWWDGEPALDSAAHWEPAPSWIYFAEPR